MKLIFSLILLSAFINLANAQRDNELFDSIYVYRELSNKSSFSKEERIKYIKRAIALSKKTKQDTTILKSKRQLAYTYLLTGEYNDFEKLTLENLETAKELNDSTAIAFTNNILGYYNYQIASDNSESYKYYLEALKYFDALGKIPEKASALITLAKIQDEEKDHLGSEQNAIKALRILNSIEKDQDVSEEMYYVLNLLGIVSLKLENYDQSISFHNQSLDLISDIENGEELEIMSLNDLAYSYRKKGNYKESLKIFKRILDDPLLKEDMSFYGLVLDNYSFTKFLSGDYVYDEIERDLKKSLEISRAQEDQYTELAASIDLSKFYKENKKIDSSLKYAKKSFKLSKEIPMNDLLLESMRILADLTEGEESNSYLERHIKLSDSLLRVERAVRNKHARIELQTDQLEAENEQISRENLYLLILSAGLLLTAILVYLFISQRAKNRKLKLIQVQQKANEDIYNLMLSQQDKVDEARTLEKRRISEELHDGVLGRLFGTRLSLDSINFKNGKEAMTTRANYIGQLKTIEEDIRKISHELNTDFVSGSGFVDIVSELIENQTQAYGLTYDFNYTDDISWDSVSNKTKINIYRIIQESMQNIYKHANAKHIKISISLEKDVICLDIIDDGEGFDTSKSKKGIGLKNMTSRVEDINGKITFTSQSGNGTTVNVKIPYNNQST